MTSSDQTPRVTTMYFSGRFVPGLVFALILFVNIKVSSTNFIGCYADKPNRALKEIFVESLTMTVDYCKKVCRDNDFMYAGLQYGKQCFCGDAGYDKYYAVGNCNTPCNGNNAEICGGTWANSVYEVGAPGFIGCFTDRPVRAMNDDFTSSNTMTTKSCKGYCRDNGYMYAALQYGGQCFCGNHGYDKYGRSTNCNMHCKGNNREFCGGYWANAVYKVGAPGFIGCFTDRPVRAMNDDFTSSNTMTTKSCKGYCRDNGYMYAALQYGGQCFCGNHGYDKYGRSKNCNMHCKGNNREFCGGYWANAVYKVGAPDFIGCFTDRPVRAMNDDFTSSNTMTTKSCKGYCRDNGYMYAALQYGGQCFCGNHGYDKYGRSKNCNMHCKGNNREFCGGYWANAVYKVGDSDFIGCFRDTHFRAMGHFFTTPKKMHVTLCKEHCRNTGFMYAALQYGKQCYCGNHDYDKYGKSTNCNMRCQGNDKEFCGGYWANSVYKVGDFIGCYADRYDRALNDIFASSDLMSVEWCRQLCDDSGFKHAALQFGKQCFCGNDNYGKYGPSTNCNMDCAGKNYETCGGYFASSVYRI